MGTKLLVAKSAAERQVDVSNLVMLLDRLGRLARTGEPQAKRFDSREYAKAVATVLQVLQDPHVGVPVFMTCAHIFRSVGAADHGILDAGIYDAMRQRLEQAARPLQALSPKVGAAVARLEATGKDVLSVHEADVARECGLDPAHMGRLLRRQTGLGFREWRWGIVMRLAVRALISTNDQVKFIAAESGFASHSGSTAGFERSFHRLFGMAPGQFRHFVRDLVPLPH